MQTQSHHQAVLAGQAACLGATAVLLFGPLLGVSDVTNAIVTILAGFVFTLLHGSMTLGWKRLGVFLAITSVVSFTSEAIGVATGWIFGSYYYSDHLGPKILGVPPMIQTGYVSMGYASLITARIILGALKTPRTWAGIGAVTLTGTLIMVSWDLVMDPFQSTYSGDWVWRDGGAHFGVPIHNYFGWFGTVFVLMFLYMAYERAHPVRSSGRFAALPVVYYALIAAGIIVTPFYGIALPMSSSLALTTVFVMGMPVALAFARVLTRTSLRGSAPSRSGTATPPPEARATRRDRETNSAGRGR